LYLVVIVIVIVIIVTIVVVVITTTVALTVVVAAPTVAFAGSFASTTTRGSFAISEVCRPVSCRRLTHCAPPEQQLIRASVDQ
jgi:hypothetical protein